MQNAIRENSLKAAGADFGPAVGTVWSPGKWNKYRLWSIQRAKGKVGWITNNLEKMSVTVSGWSENGRTVVSVSFDCNIISLHFKIKQT